MGLRSGGCQGGSDQRIEPWGWGVRSFVKIKKNILGVAITLKLFNISLLNFQHFYLCGGLLNV